MTELDLIKDTINLLFWSGYWLGVVSGVVLTYILKLYWNGVILNGRRTKSEK